MEAQRREGLARGFGWGPYPPAHGMIQTMPIPWHPDNPPLALKGGWRPKVQSFPQTNAPETSMGLGDAGARRLRRHHFPLRTTGVRGR